MEVVTRTNDGEKEWLRKENTRGYLCKHLGTVKSLLHDQHAESHI